MRAYQPGPGSCLVWTYFHPRYQTTNQPKNILGRQTITAEPNNGVLIAISKRAQQTPTTNAHNKGN
jgi:hypothetical protein